ncbi:MAG: 3-phosphoserine/phosphohydroxythreonine transaminase [Rhodanobacteraceae bacterium]
MDRTFNFSAGPAMLPQAVLCQAQAELLQYDGAHASVMEISHRSKEFIALAEESERDLRDLLDIPANYRVLFLQGGATQHFAQIPMNLARPDQVADYLLTGYWGEKALAEARPYVGARVAASSSSRHYRAIPAASDWDLDAQAAYVHYTPNETIHGVEFHNIPEVGTTPLIADMSSDILSRPIDVARFGLIYAGAQKNIGPSGLVVVIVRDDLLERCPGDIARIFNYAEHARRHSMLNTPNTFAWYLAGLTFKWLKREGGLGTMEERNRNKAQLLYDVIDASGFYENPVESTARSRMNVPFTLADPAIDAVFLEQAAVAGLLGLKGHRAVGGMRASIYNAMPLAGVEALVAFMRDFERCHG